MTLIMSCAADSTICFFERIHAHLLWTGQSPWSLCWVRCQTSQLGQAWQHTKNVMGQGRDDSITLMSARAVDSTSFETIHAHVLWNCQASAH
jgi:hypothetical protein